MATAERSLKSEDLVAAKGHTAVLMLLIAGFGVLARVLVSDRPAAMLREEHVLVYFGGVAMEWSLFLYVLFGIRRGGIKTVRQIIDESSWSIPRWLLYVDRRRISIHLGLVRHCYRQIPSH